MSYSTYVEHTVYEVPADQLEALCKHLTRSLDWPDYEGPAEARLAEIAESFHLDWVFGAQETETATITYKDGRTEEIEVGAGHGIEEFYSEDSCTHYDICKFLAALSSFNGSSIECLLIGEDGSHVMHFADRGTYSSANPVMNFTNPTHNRKGSTIQAMIFKRREPYYECERLGRTITGSDVIADNLTDVVNWLRSISGAYVRISHGYPDKGLVFKTYDSDSWDEFSEPVECSVGDYLIYEVDEDHLFVLPEDQFIRRYDKC